MQRWLTRSLCSAVPVCTNLALNVAGAGVVIAEMQSLWPDVLSQQHKDFCVTDCLALVSQNQCKRFFLSRGR